MKRQQEKRDDAKQASGSIVAYIGLLADKAKKKATIEEMNEAIERGWAQLD